jgi:hypothetical protein
VAKKKAAKKKTARKDRSKLSEKPIRVTDKVGEYTQKKLDEIAVLPDVSHTGRPKETLTWVGRPTKFEHWMIQEAYEYMSKGRTKRSLAGHLMITPDALYDYLKAYPEFSDAVKMGHSVSEGIFSEDVRTGVWNTKHKSLNANAASLFGRNVYGWDARHKENEDKSKTTFVINYKPAELGEGGEE